MQAATTAGPTARLRDLSAAAADAASFEAFCRAEADRVRRALAVSLGDAHTAGEAVDEAMTRALARWGRVSRLDSPAAWATGWGSTGRSPGGGACAGRPRSTASTAPSATPTR